MRLLYQNHCLGAFAGRVLCERLNAFIIIRMILSDRDIKMALSTGRIKLTPAPDFAVQLGSCSLDLRLGNEVKLFRRSKISSIDLKEMPETDKIMENIIISEDEP